MEEDVGVGGKETNIGFGEDQILKYNRSATEDSSQELTH